MGMEPKRGRAGYRGAVFDLDGLLIDSEPIWRWAQSVALGERGAVLTEAMQRESAGLGLDAALALWRAWFPRADLEASAIRRRLDELALERLTRSGQAKPGAVSVIGMCAEAGCALAVASSSSPLFIRAALARLGVESSFRAIASGDEVALGKPHPDVYLAAAGRLGLRPADCLAFEDSLHGLRSAKAAGMDCIAVPEEPNRGHPGYAAADRVLASLEDFQARWLQG